MLDASVSPANRSDGFLGSDMSQDDGPFFDGKPEDFYRRSRGQGVAAIQKPNNFFLMRNRDGKTRNSQRHERTQKFPQISHEKWDKYRIKFPRAKCRVVQEGRERVPDWIANHTIHARPL